MTNIKKRNISAISRLHYAKLFFRSFLFIITAAAYIADLFLHQDIEITSIERHPYLYFILWVIFAIEMVLRFFPSGYESMGCQKQFAKNYTEAPKNSKAKMPANISVASVAVAWIVLNGLIGILYVKGIIDEGILILIALFYSISDMICILFFCPFQTWFMKNKCCVSCRIYNWDYLMMFTPLIFIKNPLTWSIFAGSFILFVKWEVTAHRHPERFYEITNGTLACANCKEKLCTHKNQLRSFIDKNRDSFFRTVAEIKESQLYNTIEDIKENAIQEIRSKHHKDQ